MYRYTVKFYEDDTLKVQYGITHGYTYNEALNYIAEYYGEEAIVEVTIRFINENNILHCSDEVAEYITKENNE